MLDRIEGGVLDLVEELAARLMDHRRLGAEPRRARLLSCRALTDEARLLGQLTDELFRRTAVENVAHPTGPTG